MNDLEEYLLKAARMRPPTAQREQEELVLEDEVRASTPMLQRMPATTEPNAPADATDSKTATNDPMATGRDSLQSDALFGLLSNPSTLAQAFVMAELLKRPVERWERNW